MQASRLGSQLSIKDASVFSLCVLPYAQSFSVEGDVELAQRLDLLLACFKRKIVESSRQGNSQEKFVTRDKYEIDNSAVTEFSVLVVRRL
eukprot:4230636-Pleurochrysis_carterae.AAC.3